MATEKVVVSEAFSLTLGTLNRHPQIQAVVNYVHRVGNVVKTYFSE